MAFCRWGISAVTFESVSGVSLFRSKSFLGLLLGLFSLAAFGSAQAATTYFVRADGGNAAQCTGRADAPYPGSGTAQACAWNSPHHALPASGVPRIMGGDTLIIGAGSYRIGWGAPGAAGGRCFDLGSYDCYLAPVPSGPSATAKTRILGRGFDSGCKAPPRLWGSERVSTVLNLEGSSNVEVGCLEITDQSDCVEFHTDSAARCQRDSRPYGNWASVGLSAKGSRNVHLFDLNIHGLATSGIHAGALADWTLDRVKINANGWIGWNGDIGASSSNAGRMVMRQVEIAWNGCGQKWQTGASWACWAQEGGGYGDGLGTALTGGQWLIEDSFVHHNTSDGIDLLYMDGAANTSITLRRVYAVGNAGNQIKTKGAVLIENSVVVGNCAYFDGKDNMLAGDQCRAQGNALSIGMVNGQNATVRHNTITGEGDCLILTIDGDQTSTLNIQNNALIGQPDFLSTRGGAPEQTCGHYAHASTAKINYAGNLVYRVKQDQCPPGSICGRDPMVTSMAMASFDAAPVAGSPLIDTGTLIGGVTSDFLLQPRPVGASSDIGAIEVQAGDTATTPVCTRAAPTISLTGPATAATAGSLRNYALTLTNRDSSACAATYFSLAKRVPAGWTGSLAAGLSLAPGASSTIVYGVTSPGTAAAGTYGIGAGVSSGSGSTHTAGASATYTIATATDTTKPFVTAVKPTTTSGTIVLSAKAGDNIAVTKVEFWVDGVRRGEDATSPYARAMNSGVLANGTHTLVAKAFDAAGNSRVSGPVTFTVYNASVDVTPPVVSASVAGTAGTITLSAKATDNVGVKLLEFFIDGVRVGSRTAGTHNIAYDSRNLRNGTHTMEVYAFDTAGNYAFKQVAFTVGN